MVISNTTPFISLSSVNLLHLLPTIFGEVYVPPSVVDECSEGGRIVVPDLSVLSWVKVMATQGHKPLPALFELDRGERDTLLLAASHTGTLVLMDEKLGRNMAEYLGIQVMGTLGVLAMARTRGHIPSFSQAASDIRSHGVYFNVELIQRIAARIGESN